MDITQDKIESIIKEYVDTNLPNEVEKYYQTLKEQKEAKLAKYADKTFVHNKLMWQDMPVNQTKQMSVAKLKVYCRGLGLANRKDWRAPTYYELLELIDYSRVPSGVKGLQYVAKNPYWSTSKDITKRGYFWVVDFQEGLTDTQNSLDSYSIRCVRTLSTKRGEY